MFRYTAILFSVLFIRPCSAQDEVGDVASDRETRRQADKELAKNVLAFTDDDGQLAVATTANQWQRRRRQIVSAMESVMGKLPDHPDRSPPAMTILEEVDCGAYIRKKITYLSQPNCQTPAYLCVPKTVSEDPPQRFPAALCLHPTDNKVGHDVVVGLGGKPNRQYASELAARGYVHVSAKLSAIGKLPARPGGTRLGQRDAQSDLGQSAWHRPAAIASLRRRRSGVCDWAFPRRTQRGLHSSV